MFEGKVLVCDLNRGFVFHTYPWLLFIFSLPIVLKIKKSGYKTPVTQHREIKRLRPPDKCEALHKVLLQILRNYTRIMRLQLCQLPALFSPGEEGTDDDDMLTTSQITKLVPLTK